MAEPQLHRALVLLGSNIDREQNLPLRLEQLAGDPEIHLVKASGVYESAAVGGTGPQPVFSNAAALLETALPPAALRQRLRGIEAALGRVRSADKYAPRPIDLDIVLYDEFVGQVEGSQIPDPDLLRFAHVAQPCAEIAPEWIHPLRGQALVHILEAVDCTSLALIGAPR